MFNLFKSSKKLPAFPTLSAFAHKSQYFRRTASWTSNGKDIIVADSHRPRIITMDPWPQIIFIAADGQMTIEQYVHYIAKQYSGKVPEELDVTIINEIQSLLNEKLIELCETQQRPEQPFDLPGNSDESRNR